MLFHHTKNRRLVLCGGLGQAGFLPGQVLGHGLGCSRSSSVRYAAMSSVRLCRLASAFGLGMVSPLESFEDAFCEQWGTALPTNR